MSHVHFDANVRPLPIRPKPGRRCANAIHGAPLAPILAFHSVDATDSPDQRLRKIDEITSRLARAMLDAVRATREISELLDEVLHGK